MGKLRSVGGEMRLTDLEPSVLRNHGPRWTFGGSIADADGLMFLCPVCYMANGGPVGTHVVVCWRPRVPLSVSPGPGRWEFDGDSLDNLSLVAGSSSIKLTGGCNAHFYVKNGQIEVIP